MKYKIILTTLILTLFLMSSVTNAVNINDIKIENEIDLSESSPGGWHEEVCMQVHGKDFSDIYKIGGNEGYWEVPYDTYAVKMVADHNRIRAVYDFLVNDGPVNSVKMDIEYKDVGTLSDGPDVMIYKWDESWDTKSNIAGAGNTELFYGWWSHTFSQNGADYVSQDGKIRVGAQAFDDDSWWHQDKIAVKKIKITYQTADEALYNINYNPYDDDNDGSNDSIEVILDADVGDYGDGTTVDVTANCELINPNGIIVDTEAVSWTIIDHQVETASINLTSLGGINGDYKINITLIDEYGNEEDTASHTLYLEPDPQRTITFLTTEGGNIIFNDVLYTHGQTNITSDGIYNIQASPDEYYVFSHWESTDGVNVSIENLTKTETTVEVFGDGFLKAYYDFTLYTVMFFIDPENAGIIQLGGYDFENNTGCYVEEGEYEIAAVANEPDYYFDHWEATEGASFDDIYSANTIVNFSYDSYIMAVFTENLAPDNPEKPDGPNSGEINTELEFSTSTIDPNGNKVYYQWSWGDGTFSDWLGPYNSGAEISTTHAFSGPRDYEVKVKAKDETGLISDWSTPIIVSISSRPTAPQISGPNNGQINTDYDFTFVSTDLEGDDLYYYIEWGDGEVIDWDGPYKSGEEAIFTHQWAKKQSFTIKAMAKDENDVVSDFSTFSVSMPREKTTSFYLLNFLERFPVLYNFLNVMLKFV
jgi:hypothetical protein